MRITPAPILALVALAVLVALPTDGAAQATSEKQAAFEWDAFRSTDRARARLPGRGRGRRQHAAPREPAPDRGLLQPRLTGRPGLRELRPRVPAQPSSSWATSTASTPTTSRTRRSPRLPHVGRLPRRPGRRVGPRQPAVHVGRADARPRSTAARRAWPTPVSAERFRGVRIFDISDSSKPKQIAAVQTCRGSHTHTLVADPNDTDEPLRLRLGHEHGAPGRGARRLLRREPGRGSEHRALQHRRDPGAARARPRRRAIVNRAAHLRRPDDGRHRRALDRAATTARARRRRAQTNQCHDITVFPGDRPRRGRLLGQRHPARHLAIPATRSGSTRSPTRTSPTGTRRRSTTTARKVIFTDEWGGGTRPRCRATDPLELGRRRHLRHRRRQAEVRELLQDAGAADRAGELRRAQRLAHPGARAATSWCRRWYQGGVSVFDFTDSAQPGRDRVSSIAARSTRTS